MHCVAALHGPVPPQLQCTALDTAADGTCWSGAADGSITRWQKQQQDGGSAVQPVALLQGHAHPVVALLSGLTAVAGSINSSSSSSGGGGGSYLLSLDAEGWVGLWDCSSWVCLDMTRAAPLPPGCSPTLLLMPDGDHVCIIVPATPSLQQEQQTLWQHQRNHQQQQAAAHHSSPLPPSPTLHPHPQQQHPHPQQQQQQQTSPGPGPATAANLSPMMLVLRWASLALVSAPLVSNLGLAVLTSSSISLGDQGDAVVAAAVLQTQPALAPAAADSVVLVVMRSGWMWAGSLAGSSLGQAWEKPLVSGGVSAPLRQGCLWTTTTNSGSSGQQQQQDAAGVLQLQLLLVQPDGWRLLVCSSFSSLDGMPQHWVQLAAQQQLLLLQEPGGQQDRLTSKQCGMQGQHHCQQDAAAAAKASGISQRVRFEVQQGCGVGGMDIAEAGATSGSSTQSSWSGSSSSGSSGADSEGEGESSREDEAGAESDGSVARGRQCSRLQRVTGPQQHHRQHKRQQHVPHLLGGTLLQPVQNSSNSTEAWQQQQQQQQEGAAVAVLAWLDTGEQQLWSVPLLTPEDTQQGLQQQQQQQQLVQLVQQVQLQPWPVHAAVKLFAAVDKLHTSVALLTQHSRHTHHHLHNSHHRYPTHHHRSDHTQQQQQRVGGSSARCSSHSSNGLLLDDAAPHMWNLHCLQLQLAAVQSQQPTPQQLQLQAHQQQQQQQGCLPGLPVQQLPWQLHHCQGSWVDAWARHQTLDSTSSTTGGHSSAHHWDIGSSFQNSGGSQQQQQQQQLRDEASSRSYAVVGAAGADAMQVDEADSSRLSTSGSSSRKRPAVGEPAAAESGGAAAGVSSEEGAAGVAPGCRIKQPRVQESAAGAAKEQQAAPGQAGSCWLGQQQQVTHMLLLGSDAPGLHQLAVILASGTILFYDLATYCVPGAAWHPDCCCVGAGHMGRVSTTLEVTFKCPPQHLLGYQGPAGAGNPMHGGSLPRPVSWHFSSTTAAAGECSTRSSQDGGHSYCTASSSGDGGSSRAGGQHQHQQYQQSEVVDCPAAAQGWCRRPGGGGVVPLLLTGAADGSLRGWDLRVQQLGHMWMAAHPHTAPVEAIVLPPVSSRLPWSTCVLSMCTAGRVALTCLASGSTTRTFDGWSLGPPAQLAWSTGRGLLAAGGWDAAGVWQVAVWDTYTGQLDRLLQGAAAHMLMAALGQELTSSMRHLSRSAQTQQAQGTNKVPTGAAKNPAGLSSSGVTATNYTSSSSASGAQQRASFDVPAAGSQAASADGAKGSSSGSCEAAGFMPRLQLVRHSGPIQAVPGSRPDVLMLDIDVQQLVAQLGAHSKQQKRENSSRQRQQQQVATGFNRSSLDVDSHSTPSASARASRASSLDLVGLVHQGSQGSGEVHLLASAAASTRTSPQQQTPGPAGGTAGQVTSAHQAACAGMSRQGSLASAVAAAAGEQAAAQGSAQVGLQQVQERPVHARRAMVPAVAAAVQGLCLLHKWGLEPKLDQQLLLLLQQLQGWPEPATQQLLTQRSSSTLPPQSPSTPSTARGVSTAAVAGFAGLAESISPSGQNCKPAEGGILGSAVPGADGVQEQLLHGLHLQMLQGPAAGSPVLQAGAPCLSQEVLLSPCCHASVLTLPTVRSISEAAGSCHGHEQQQSEEQQLAAEGVGGHAGGLGVAGHSHAFRKGRKAGGAAACISSTNLMLLTACLSLLSARLLTLVAVSKWLMASVTTHTSVNTCSGLVTLYALHSSELLTQAATAVQAAATAPSSLQQQAGASPTPTSSSPGVQDSRKQPYQQQPGLSHAARDLHPTPPVVPDLLLISSTAVACPGLLAEAAQLLMAALLHPAAPGTFLLPTMTAPHQQQLGWTGRGPAHMQQQHEDAGEQVFTSPGAAAAASCWPPAVLQLAVLQAQQMQQQQQQEQQGSQQQLQANPAPGLSLQQLPKWMSLLVLSAAAAVAHPTRMPVELLAAVSAGLLDVLLGAAPAHSSCVAASWLSQVLHGAHWAVWRPCLGKPGQLVHRLCHLVDRLQANSTDSRSAASHLVSQSLSSTPGLLHPTTMHNNSSSGSNPNLSASTSAASDFTLLLQQPYAVADPLSAGSGIGRGFNSAASTTSSSQAAGWSGARIPPPQHVEGGLFLSAALMGPATSRGGSPWPGGSLSRSVSPAAVGSLLEGSPAGRGAGAVGSGAWGGSGSGSATGGSQSDYCSSAAGQQHAGLQPLHRTSTGLTYSYAGGHGHGMAVVGASSAQGASAGVGGVREQQQQAQVSGVQVPVSRSVLVVWLRAALDVLAALMHVDPAAVLMELSHKLAAPSAESSGTSLTLLFAAVSRLLKRPSERPGLLPHLGFIAALAVQALDPNRAQLRHTLLQPAMGVVRDLASHFPQVDCHSSSLQVAVGSTRSLAPGLGSAAAGVEPGGVVQAPTVAVFDMNGGTKKRVLLLPVLMDDDNIEQQSPQQQRQGSGGQGVQHAPAGPAGSTRHLGAAGHVGPFGSTNSLHSTTSTTSNADNTGRGPQGLAPGHVMSGALPGLWSTAEGVPVPAAAGAAAGGRHSGHSGGWGGVLGGSSSSLSSSTAFDTPGDSRSSSFGRLGELQRSALGGNTMTRAEAAMLEGWFGGSPGGSDDGGLSSGGAAAAAASSRHPEGHQQQREGGAAAAGSGGYGVSALPRGRAPSSMQCGVIYPDASMAASPVLCASEVSGGVAAVAFSPGGDAVAAFVLESYCLVVWRLGGSWTQRLAHLGSSRPMSQLPHAYIRLPTAALLVNAVFKDGVAGQQQQHQRHHRHHHHHGESEGGELLQWQLKWQTHSHIDLLYHGCLCGSVEVHL